MYENGTLVDKLKKDKQQTAKERAESNVLQVCSHFQRLLNDKQIKLICENKETNKEVLF
jgi:hypothetical protein